MKLEQMFATISIFRELFVSEPLSTYFITKTENVISIKSDCSREDKLNFLQEQDQSGEANVPVDVL